MKTCWVASIIVLLGLSLPTAALSQADDKVPASAPASAPASVPASAPASAPAYKHEVDQESAPADKYKLLLQYRYRRYGGIDTTAALPQELANHLIGLSVAADYMIMSWIYVGLGYELMFKALAPYPLPNSLGGTYVNDYTRHQVTFKVGFSY